MNRSNQGSAHVVIIIILVVALLSTLGFVFWQNLNKPKTDQTTTQSSSSTHQTDTTKLMDGGVAGSFPTPLTWKFPETWSLNYTGNGPESLDDTSVQTLTLTSPSEKYTVTYSVGINGGRGGTCGGDTSTVEYISQAPIAGLVNGRYVEFISNRGDLPGYTYISGITENSDSVKSAKVGTSSCFFGIGGLTLSAEHNYTLLQASIGIKDLDDENGYPKATDNIATIKSAFNDDEYIQAKNILLSTKLGN